MRSATKLIAVLAVLTSLEAMETARIHWNNTFSPSDGWRGIRHRSQKKKRILASRVR